MGKYLKNVLAFFKGGYYYFLSKLRKDVNIQTYVRIFISSDIEIDKKAKFKLGCKVKIRERAKIAVRKNAELVIGNRVSVGMDNKIVCHNRIEIGDGTLLSPNVLIYDHNHKYSVDFGVEPKAFDSEPILIGKNCWIGANTVILKGTIIGDNCVIGAGSVIKGNYPKGSIVIQKREEIIKSRKMH